MIVTRRLLVLFLLIFSALSLAFQIFTLKRNDIELYYAKEWLSLAPVNYQKATILNTVDGSTVRVAVNFHGENVKLIGVDTSESVNFYKPAEYFEKVLSLFTGKLLLMGEEILPTYDWNMRDEYGRPPTYVCSGQSIKKRNIGFLHNFVLIIDGPGRVYTVPPFGEDYMKIFREVERYARDNRMGLWENIDEEKVVGAFENGSCKPQGTVSETAVAQTMPSQAQVSVKIVEIQAYGEDEYVLIKNTGSSAVNLADWKLFSQGGQWFTFPFLILNPGETLSIHTGPQAGISSPASNKLIWSKRYTWNNQGDKATLYDAQGNVVDEYAY